MFPSELTADLVTSVIRDPRNERCRVWTATTLLARLGIPSGYLKGQDFTRYKPLHRRAVRILRALWLQGMLYQREPLDSSYGIKQVRYIHTESASGVYLVPCERCAAARRCALHPEGRIVEPCPECNLRVFRPQID